MGNDINDIECMQIVGLPVCVADAYPEAKAFAKWITTSNGGYGAVREFCDLILYSKQLKKVK
jgi:3-deoxy-D-manno-octulosonate 8-phosphate phosphatase (KDO 8-P phosphatase)